MDSAGDIVLDSNETVPKTKSDAGMNATYISIENIQQLTKNPDI